VLTGKTVQQDYWWIYYSYILFYYIKFLEIYSWYTSDFKGMAERRLGGFHWLWAASELLALEIEANECTLYGWLAND
jgi:hypothetical protein